MVGTMPTASSNMGSYIRANHCHRIPEDSTVKLSTSTRSFTTIVELQQAESKREGAANVGKSDTSTI
jgi:hypothetical protein